jgi:hypothetical protein
MANVIPLIIAAGQIRQMQAGDTISSTLAPGGGGGGGATATTFEQNLGATAACSGKFTLTDAAIAATSKVLCWQAPGPYTGKGTLADEAAMQPVKVVAVVPATGSAVIHWETDFIVGVREVPASGSRNIATTIANLLPTMFEMFRLGKVRGNIKFSYVIFA